MRAWNEPSCAGNHHSPHELGATLEGSSVREHRPQLLLHSPASQLAAQVLFTCAAAQHDAAPQQQNSEVQAHAHSNRDHSDSPRPHAQRPASYYSCSEGGVIKYEAREFSSRICSNRASSHSCPCSSQSYNFQTCRRSTAVVSRAISLHCM